MAKYAVIYKAGVSKPQYRADRWERFEKLRVAGFLKKEAREFSRIEKGDPTYEAVCIMVAQRRDLLSRFNRESRESNWSPKQRSYFWASDIRAFYKRNGYTTTRDKDGLDTKGKPGGIPSPFEWLRHTELRMLSRKKRSKKGGEDAPPPKKRKTPTKKGQNKGQVAKQRARARLRNLGYKYGFTRSSQSRASVAQAKLWISNLRETQKREPNRAGAIEKQISVLERGIEAVRK